MSGIVARVTSGIAFAVFPAIAFFRRSLPPCRLRGDRMIKDGLFRRKTLDGFAIDTAVDETFDVPELL